MAKIDPHIAAHYEWIGFVQPTGLVVSPTALMRAGAILDRSDAEGQQLLRDATETRDVDARAGRATGRETGRGVTEREDGARTLPSFENFARTVLDWNFSPKGYSGTPERPIPDELVIVLPDYRETLRPDFAVVERDPENGKPPWQLLVRVLEPGRDFDRVSREDGELEASAHGRMERLLRQTGVPAGLLFNGHALRLLSAPGRESSGWMDFRVQDMVQTSGRPICSALRLLLRQSRLLSLPRAQRFAALLSDSRKFQNEVSERLAEQVLHALYELLRGFQAAHDRSNGTLLRAQLAEHPDEVYRALLTVILRLVFVLYAEERDMLPAEETFVRGYSLAGLYERLREDAALYPDTMDQRYGAWSQLVVLFRMIYDGADAEAMHLPRRHGILFDPDRFPFLEGRASVGARQIDEMIEVPLVPDGTVYRALEKLLVLDGERISYRALDVEEIGSVYETMMGFRLETASGRSLAIRSQKKQGAPTAVDLDALLSEAAAKRAKAIEDHAGRKLSDSVKKAVAQARTIQDLHAALLPVVDLAATPDLVPKGAMVLQPSEERRRSGSHYTPRALTEPIVRTTLEPILAALRVPIETAAQAAEPISATRPPRPEAILNLKVCDPAMGSGAFLVEACRQLGDALLESWRAYGEMPTIPPDENESIYASRIVAQRCLYGVDRNPVAVDLAKVSLWLATLAKDHALTFLDHALRHGDSLVGLSRAQIEAFHWEAALRVQEMLETGRVRAHVAKASELRRRIREAGEDVADFELRALWDDAEVELAQVRLHGDLAVSAFFEGENAKTREAKRGVYANAVLRGSADRYLGELEERRHAEPPFVPFHWEIEFPEVFERENPGFDAAVGNPPFAGKNSVAASNLAAYLDWLKELHEDSHGNADLVAHFFRRVFTLLRKDGAFGLIATNTIAQGDTRGTGLRWICKNSGTIFTADRRVKWPGLAAVIVSVIHVRKGAFANARILDERKVETITAFLFHRGGHDDPARLAANAGKSFQGCIVLGAGFTFDDTDTNGVATPLAEMRWLIEKDSRNQEVIFPYIGGEEVNTSPTHAHHRYVINFGARSEEECRQRWPDLMAIVEEKAKGRRGSHSTAAWWHLERSRPELYSAVAGLNRVLVVSQTSKYRSVAFVPTGIVYDQRLIVFPFVSYSAFCVLHSRAHEHWALFFGSTMKDDPVYTPSDCFETFPFPENWETHPAIEAAGKGYHKFRVALMAKNDEGLTKTYNRFHDPFDRDSEMETLRRLHADMDCAILSAYGWEDIPTACEFLLAYDIDEGELGIKKKPYRYRWPNEVRDEVLARLLELNAERSDAGTGRREAT